jgi:hypothetical protein
MIGLRYKRPFRTGRQLTRLVVAIILGTAVGTVSIPPFGAFLVSTGAPTGLSASAASSATCLPGATKVAQGVTTLPSAQHCTFLEIGDSLGTDLGEGLRLQLEKNPAITLVVKTTVAAGLTNSWFYNWPGHLKKFLAQYRPQLLIVFLGANDEQAMVVNGHAAPFDTHAWRSKYESNVTTVMKEAAAVHCVVMWVGMPIMNPFGYRQKMQVINSIFSDVALKMPDATFLSTWEFMADAKGNFRFNARVNGKLQSIRTPDGIHLTYMGQNLLATYVVTQLRLTYGLALEPAYPVRFTR